MKIFELIGNAFANLGNALGNLFGGASTININPGTYNRPQWASSTSYTTKEDIKIAENNAGTIQEITVVTNGVKRRVKIVDAKVVEKEGEVGNPYEFVRKYKEKANKEISNADDFFGKWEKEFPEFNEMFQSRKSRNKTKQSRPDTRTKH